MKTPQFVKFKDGCCLRLRSETYYRDGGDWSIQFKSVDNKLTSKSPMPQLNNKELIECSKKEWMKSNKGYVPEEFKNKTFEKHLNAVSVSHGWKDFYDVVLNSTHQMTIVAITTEAHELYDAEKSKSIFDWLSEKDYLSDKKEILYKEYLER